MHVKLLAYIFPIIILLALKPGRFETFSYSFNFYLSLIYLILLLFFFFSQKPKNNNWFRLDVVFLIGFTIVHIQVPFFSSIGIEPYKPNLVWINKEVVNYATWMSVVAAVFFMLGHALVYSKSISQYSREHLKFRLYLYEFDVTLFLIFALFISVVGLSFLKGAYNTAEWGSGASYIYLILGSMLHLRIIYFFKDVPVGSSYKYLLQRILRNKVFLLCVSGYCVLFILTGSRGEVLKILLASGAAYSIFVRPISLKNVIIATLIGALVFTIIGLGRGGDYKSLGEGNVFSRGYSVLQNMENEKGITSELASSVRIQYRAIDAVPDKHPYLYGVTFISAITSSVPFLTGIYVKVFDVPSKYTLSTYFFTYLGQGNHATWGEGSEILADIYINFGIFFVFIFMFLFGAFLAFVDNKARKFNFNYIVVYVALMMIMLYISRSYLLLPLPSIVYLFALHFIFHRRRRS